MRIVIVGMTYLPGNNGQAIFTIHLAEGLARAGHEVHMITPGSRFQYEQAQVNGVHIHYLSSMNLNWLHPGANLPLFSRGQIRQIFNQYPPDIIHIQDHYFLSRDVMSVARRRGVPVMGSNHFLPENVMPYLHILPMPDRVKARILWALLLWTYDHLELVTTPTETAAKILRNQNIHVQVIPVSCGVSTEEFQPNRTLDRTEACQKFGLNPDKILFLYVGRLDREKRIDLLLRGLARLVKSGRTDIQLAIAGQGAYGDDLRNLAHSLGLDQHVHFLGYVENDHLPLLYQTAHVFCMPSPEELQSIATLEAMASERPVLAANARALPELVKHGQNGYLFESGRFESTAEGMIWLADHRVDWERMGQESRARAETHSLQNTIRLYSELYGRVSGLPHLAGDEGTQKSAKYTKDPV